MENFLPFLAASPKERTSEVSDSRFPVGECTSLEPGKPSATINTTALPTWASTWNIWRELSSHINWGQRIERIVRLQYLLGQTNLLGYRFGCQSGRWPHYNQRVESRLGSELLMVRHWRNGWKAHGEVWVGWRRSCCNILLLPVLLRLKTKKTHHQEWIQSDLFDKWLAKANCEIHFSAANCELHSFVIMWSTEPISLCKIDEKDSFPIVPLGIHCSHMFTVWQLRTGIIPYLDFLKKLNSYIFTPLPLWAALSFYSVLFLVMSSLKVDDDCWGHTLLAIKELLLEVRDQQGQQHQSKLISLSWRRRTTLQGWRLGQLIAARNKAIQPDGLIIDKRISDVFFISYLKKINILTLPIALLYLQIASTSNFMCKMVPFCGHHCQ